MNYIRYKKQLAVWLRARPWTFFVVLTGVVLLLLFLRRPDVFLYPQLWAEDGPQWFADAYRLGPWRALITPHTGYFQTISRFTGALAQYLPMALVPWVFVAVASVVKVLPVLLLLSRRFDAVIPSMTARALLAFIYIVTPAAAEVFLNVTNAHWHLALLATLLLIADAPRTAWGRLGDYVAVLISGLSGPFAILLTPLALWRWYRERSAHIRRMALLLGASAVLQGSTLFLTGATRAAGPLGVDAALFVEIVTGQVFVGSFFGKTGFAWLLNNGFWSPTVILLCFTLGIVLCWLAWWHAPERYRVFWLFTAFVFVAALLSPGASYSDPQWPILAMPGAGMRYWFLPSVGFLSMVLFVASVHRYRALRWGATALILIFFLNLFVHPQLPRQPDLGYDSYAQAFEDAASGSAHVIPILPQGWHLRLEKQ